jgi:3-hydroxyacyl-[acyl-carrier-protein] dehydratase
MLIDLAQIDLSRDVYTKHDIEKRNPHRYEMALLDGIAFFDAATCDAVGYHDLKADAFWVRGHIPSMPLFPGALMIECAAQLSSFCYRERFGADDRRFFGFGGIDKVKFRGMASPGQRLYVICKEIVLNRRHSRFAVQGVVDGKVAFEGEIVGVSMPVRGEKTETAESVH